MANIVVYKFHRMEVDILPVFNDGFEYTYTDTNEGSLIVRTIVSDSNPTVISFKDKNVSRIESLNLTNVQELDIDKLDLNAVNNIATLVAGCNTLKVLRAKAAVVNALIPSLQAKTNASSGIIKVADIPDLVDNNSLNIKHWYIDKYRYVDLFVMMGQSNMEGQSERPEAFEVPTYQSYTYMYNTDTLGQVKHPYGEWINKQVEDEALKQQWLADPTMDGVWWQMEGAEGGQQGAAYASLQPYFAAKYYEKTKVPTLMVQCACGATTVGEWLPGHAKGRYELAVEKINMAIAKAETEIDRPIRNKYLVWLQGESDGIYKTGTANYKTRFMQLWTGLKTDCGLEQCFMIRVAKFREGKYDDKPIIEAQEQLAQENHDIMIATRITGCLEYPTQNPDNPTIQDGVTEGYPYVDHYTIAGYKLVGETTADKIADYLRIGLRPELEPEPYEGEITSSAERLILSYIYKGTASLLPTFNSGFGYRMLDSVDEDSYTHRKIIATHAPSTISFQSKSNLLRVDYIDTSKINTAQGMFYKCSSMTYLNMPYVTYVETMEGMFNGCTKLQLIDGMEKWNTANNNNYGSAFRDLKSIKKLPIENFNVSNVHAMGAAFSGTVLESFEGFDFSKWKTPYIQYLSGTFTGVNATEIDLSSFDVRNVGALAQLFYKCTNLKKVNLSNWILTEEHYNWQGPELDLNPLTTNYLFGNCNVLDEVIMLNSNRFSIYKVAERLPDRTEELPSTFRISMEEELDNELSTLIESKGWNVDYKKVNTEYIIASYSFDPNVGNLLPVFNDGVEYTYEDMASDFGYVIRTIKSYELPTNIYFGTTHVSQDDADSLLQILELNTENVSDYSNMFKNCRGLNYLGAGIINSKAEKLTSMFEGCTSLDIIHMLKIYSENVIDMSYMFKDSNASYICFEEFTVREDANIEGMFEGCTKLSKLRIDPDTLKTIARVLPDRPFTEPGEVRLRRGLIDSTPELLDELDEVCDEEMLKHNWITDRNRHLDLFVMMGQSNMQGQSYIYKEFEVPWYQSCTYLYNSDEIAQVKHPFGEHINTQGSVEELGYYQLEGAVGCETGLPYGSLSPHFAASYFEQTKVPTLMVPCCCGASTVKQWWPGTTEQRFELSVEKTEKSIDAVKEIGRTIRHKNLVWLQGESDGYGSGVGNKTPNYKNNFLTFWRAIKEALGLEKCLIIRVAKFREGYKYNTLPIMEAQEQLALENDDIELVTRITGYLEYPAQNPENPTLQHFEQGYPASNHDHYTWEGYRLVGETAGTRVGTYMRAGVMPELEPEPFEEGVASSSKYHVATYKFDNTIYSDYVPEFNEGYQYSVIDTVEENITTRKIIGEGLPTVMRFGAYYTYEEIESVQRTATERELCLKEVVFADTSAVTDATNMFCLNENLTSIPALVIQNCTSLYCMFYKCNNLTYIDGRNFNMSKVKNVENFTWQCKKLVTVDATGWDMSNVNNMYTMFINANALTEIKGVEDWNVSNAKTLISTFYGCRALTSLDLSKWNVENATTIWWMFNGCLALTTLNLSNWHLTNCVDFTAPFANCKALNNVVMKNSDYNTVNNIIAVLPTKTVDAPGTLVLDGVEGYDQINLEAAAAKHWGIEHKVVLTDFDKKIVNGEMLNIFAKKINRKIKEDIQSSQSNMQIDEEQLINDLNNLFK